MMNIISIGSARSPKLIPFECKRQKSLKIVCVNNSNLKVDAVDNNNRHASLCQADYQCHGTGWILMVDPP